MSQVYDVGRRIRTASVPNVDTARLVGRLEYLRAHKLELLRDTEQKYDVRVIAREVVNIERELARRGVPFRPVSDGRHLEISVWEVREVRPPPPGSGRMRHATTV